jgi:poly(A) polymerase
MALPVVHKHCMTDTPALALDPGLAPLLARAAARLVALPRVQVLLGHLDPLAPGGTRLVGGCVRDALMGREILDVDVATVLRPLAVQEALTRAGIKVVPTGIDHGTVTAVIGSQPLEITTLRKDVSTDGRRATVAYTDDWAEDAARRDFRLNTLLCTAEGAIIDPTGHGIADARAGRIVFVGEPARRIAEDSLRILRFFRFQAWYGTGEPDREALAACGEGRGLMANLSVERVWKELKRLLAAPDPGASVRAMAATGVLGAVLPEAEGTTLLTALLDLETSQFVETDPMQRLMALIPRDPQVAQSLAARLRLSRAEADRLGAWAGDRTRIVSWLSARDVRAALYWMGPQLWLDRVRLDWAGDGAARRIPQWRALAALASGYARPAFPVSGDSVLKAGARPGPAIGAILAELERWWVEADFIEDEFSLAERLKALVQALG